MKREFLGFALCGATFMPGYLLGLIFVDFSQLFMFWAGMLYLGGLRRLQVTEYKLNPLLRTSIPAGCYVLLTPHETMIVTPDPDDIKRSIDITKAKP